jgi:hypothetical protein
MKRTSFMSFSVERVVYALTKNAFVPLQTVPCRCQS